MKDNGYEKWLKIKNSQTKKRFKFLIAVLLLILTIDAILYFFGYDSSITTIEKITNILIGSIGLVIISIIISFIKYKIPKFIPVCNKCGVHIKDIQKDCFTSNIDFISSEERTEYEAITSTTEGEITNIKQSYIPPYNGFGYPFRVYNNEAPVKAKFTTTSKIPINRKYYKYKLDYCCKNCQELFCSQIIETTKKLK